MPRHNGPTASRYRKTCVPRVWKLVRPVRVGNTESDRRAPERGDSRVGHGIRCVWARYCSEGAPSASYSGRCVNLASGRRAETSNASSRPRP